MVDPPTEVKVDCDDILKISDGIIKLFCWSEYCAHIPENAAEGDLVIGDVGTSLDMLQKIDRAKKMQVISRMVWGTGSNNSNGRSSSDAGDDSNNSR